MAEQKHELLFTRFGLNYAHLPLIVKRGTTLVRRSFAGTLSAEDGIGSGVAAERRKANAQGIASVATSFIPTSAAASDSLPTSALELPAPQSGGPSSTSTSSASEADLQSERVLSSEAPLQVPKNVVYCFPDYHRSADFLGSVFKYG